MYASYASPHASRVSIVPQERASGAATAIAPVRAPTAEVRGAQVSTNEYVSAHLLAVGQYRGEEEAAQRNEKRGEKG